jgi:hypothetical protein
MQQILSWGNDSKVRQKWQRILLSSAHAVHSHSQGEVVDSNPPTQL